MYVSLSIEVRDVSRLRHTFCVGPTSHILSLLNAAHQRAHLGRSSRTPPSGCGVCWCTVTLLVPTARLSLLSLPGSEALRSFSATRLIADTQVLEITLLVSFGGGKVLIGKK